MASKEGGAGATLGSTLLAPQGVKAALLLAAFATEPQYGRIITRFAKSEAKASFGNKKWDGTMQRGVELYYRIDDAYLNSDKVDRFQIDAHYSVDQGRTRIRL